MNLLEQIIVALTDSSIPLQDTLLKLKVFAEKVQNKDLIDLITSELEGYNGKNIPPYREIRNPIIGNINNGHTRYTNTVLPIAHLDKRLANILLVCKLSYSVASLEEFLKTKDELNLGQAIPPECYNELSKAITSGHQVESARMPISKGDISGILTKIKSKLLDMMLEIEQSVDDDTAIQLFKAPDEATKTTINNILNNNIHNIFESKNDSKQDIKIELETQSN